MSTHPHKSAGQHRSRHAGRGWQTACLAAVGLLLLAGDAFGCPTCKDAIADGGNGYNLVQGYGWSIVFMMSMPFVIFFSLGGYFYYEVRKAQRQREAVEEQPSVAVQP